MINSIIFVSMITMPVMMAMSVFAAIIHVPAEQPTIQAGIDAAVDGDTIFVADGTYSGSGNKEIDFNGKAITVLSENGPETCIIACQNTDIGFYFHSGELESSSVAGFTARYIVRTHPPASPTA